MNFVQPQKHILKRPNPFINRSPVAKATLAIVASFIALSGHAQPNNPAGSTASAPAAASAPLILPTHTLNKSLFNLGLEHALTLRGTDSSGQVNFGIRQDEVVESASFHLEYTLSPALLPQLSHLQVLLNGQMVQSIGLPQAQLGKPQSIDIPIDARFFTDYNKLEIRFVGHYTLECENPGNSSLWAQVSNESRLQITLRQVKLPNNLAQLPLPFFDPRDTGKVQTHFVFSETPSLGGLKAAGVMAGWLGAKADFRSSQIQVLNNQLPNGNAIVFASAQDAPAFLKTLVKNIQEPTLQLIEHPSNSAYQLLLVMGKDAAQIETAAQALALGRVALTGDVTRIQSLELPAPRKAYDAPRWRNTEQPIQFADLVSSPQQLQVKGYALNSSITTYLRVAPDLFTWNSKNIPVHLLYRYTPTTVSADGMVSMLLNQNLANSFPLENSKKSQNRLFPKFGYENDQVSQKFYVPAEWIHASNRLDFEVQMPAQEQGSCLSTAPVEVRAELDPKSTIDLSGLPHYIAMPDLQAYAQGGFPFSRLADLRETTVVLPTAHSTAATEAYLNAIAHISGITGYPGTRFQLVNDKDSDAIGDSDVLLISDGQASSLLEKWQKQLPALVEASAQSITLSQRALGQFLDLWQGQKKAPPSSGHATFQGSGPLAAVAGFESPLHKKRSVVALMGNSAPALDLIAKNISNNVTNTRFMGDLTLLNDKDIASFRVQQTYFVGELSLAQRLWFKLHEHPVTMAILGSFLGLLLSFFIYTGLRYFARRRLEQM